MNKDKLVETHRFTFNPKDNGGEQVILKTEIYDNGDDTHNLYVNQTLSLCSYSNAAHLELIGATLTPQNLRKLADELEAVFHKAQQNSSKSCTV